MQDPWTELITDPEVTLAIALRRLRVDVAPVNQRSRGALAHDREPDHSIGIGELDEVADRNGARPTLVGLEVRGEVVGANQEVTELALPPKPLSGITRYSPLGDRRVSPRSLRQVGRRREVHAVDDGLCWPSGTRPAPDGGPCAYVSTGRTARPMRCGSSPS